MKLRVGLETTQPPEGINIRNWKGGKHKGILCPIVCLPVRKTGFFMPGSEIVFVILIFITAFLYASVGHGGASGYLTLMVLFGLETGLMRSTALSLNLFVSAIAFYSFLKAGHFKFDLFWPFAVLSVPMAYLGAQLKIDATLYKIILGVFLLIAVFRLLVQIKTDEKNTNTLPIIPAVGIGAVLGFFSGMIGIGGGIILSPILLIFRWASVKQTAGISALFIFVNSLSGLGGLYFKSQIVYPDHLMFWVIAVVIGGFAGGYSGSQKFNHRGLRLILSMVMLFATYKLFVH